MAGVKGLIVFKTAPLVFAEIALKRSMTTCSRKAGRWVRKLTYQAQRYMKFYTLPRTARSEGKLNSNIDATVTTGLIHASGVAFVRQNKQTIHQYLIEYGTSSRQIITGQMSFGIESWKKAKKSAQIQKLAVNGMFFFHRVKRGKFKGKQFTHKSYGRLIKYYNKVESKILDDIGTSISIGR